jgi:hypothetical protein
VVVRVGGGGGGDLIVTYVRVSKSKDNECQVFLNDNSLKLFL